MTIQEVIDEVNNTWGEEHEEKRKKLLLENLFRDPCRTFFLWTLVYLSPLVFLIPALFISPEKTENLPIPLAEFWINIPYYFLDIRAGIIASLAGILLSLYVSVGKFADGIEGISGDARRAIYRKFARLVGEIVFLVFVINFWYGFISGYLQGTSRAPELFGAWSVGPGWGKLIVPEHIDLNRYREIPLWVLLFFAWFTMVSSRMLTYSEKDILIKSSISLNRLKNIGRIEDISYSREYEIARCEFEKEDSSEKQGGNDASSLPSQSILTKGGVSSYAEIFYSGTRYLGFSGNVNIKSYISHPQFFKIIAPWVILCALLLVVMRDDGFFFIVMESIFYGAYFLMVVESGVNLDSKIYKLNTAHLNPGFSKKFEYILFYWQVWGSRIFAYLCCLSISVSVLVKHQGMVFNIITWLKLSDETITVLILLFFLILPLVPTYIIVFIVEKFVYLSMRRIIEEHSVDTLKESLKQAGISDKDRQKIDFLVVSYIYCLMFEVNRFYMDYKNELGRTDLSSNNSESLRHRYSRPTLYKASKSSRHK